MTQLKKSFLYADMDGTLLTGAKLVTQRNIEQIRRFVSLGGQFSVATGRSEVIAAPFLSSLPVTRPAIVYNGAAVYDFSSQKFLHQEELPADLVHLFFKAAMEVYPKVCAEVYTNGMIELLNKDCIMDHYIPRENQPYRYVSPDSFGFCMKLLFYGDHDELHKVERAIYEVSGGKGFQSTFSAPYYLEILPEGVSKASALSWIFEHTDVIPQETAAIGDFYNDVAMLSLASLSAAPANAPEDVKTEVNLVVSDNEHDAVGDFIDRFLIESK